MVDQWATGPEDILIVSIVLRSELLWEKVKNRFPNEFVWRCHPQEMPMSHIAYQKPTITIFNKI